MFLFTNTCSGVCTIMISLMDQDKTKKGTVFVHKYKRDFASNIINKLFIQRGKPLKELRGYTNIKRI